MSCEYILKRGKNKGKECGEDVYKDSCYCCKHIKTVEKSSIFDELVNSVIKVNSKVERLNELEFYENDIGKYINNKGYVINCPEENVVIGRLDKIGELVYLSSEDISWCVKNKLRYERFI